MKDTTTILALSTSDPKTILTRMPFSESGYYVWVLAGVSMPEHAEFPPRKTIPPDEPLTEAHYTTLEQEGYHRD